MVSRLRAPARCPAWVLAVSVTPLPRPTLLHLLVAHPSRRGPNGACRRSSSGSKLHRAYGLWRTLGGVALGLGFIVLTRILLQLRKRRPVGFAEMASFDARKALLIVGYRGCKDRPRNPQLAVKDAS